jgi:murein DD-endopeptidase MepM/ murein hydrolase activator NlpD
VQSLYAHLSSVTVEVGDRINRGETIGRSGDTGMAGGDHLHFTMLVAGHPVSPIEWWDPHWIADRIDRKLVEAGIMSASAATKAPVVTPPAKKKAPPRAKAKPAAPKKKARKK